jgi:poly(hydroxyalkanoate) granule-associated protein
MMKKNSLPKIRQSAHEVWLAGLGALSLAGEEGGRLFKTLVKKGQGLDKLNKARIHKLADRVEALRGDAREAVARVKSPIEAGMTNAMSRLGVPSRKEIATLTKRVEELTRVVAKSRANGAKRRTSRTRSAATTTA